MNILKVGCVVTTKNGKQGRVIAIDRLNSETAEYNNCCIVCLIKENESVESLRSYTITGYDNKFGRNSQYNLDLTNYKFKQVKMIDDAELQYEKRLRIKYEAMFAIEHKKCIILSTAFKELLSL